jgi:hypothetical protein
LREAGIIETIKTQTIVSPDYDISTLSAAVLQSVARETEDMEELHTIGVLVLACYVGQEHARIKITGLRGIAEVMNRSVEFRRECVLDRKICEMLVADLAEQRRCPGTFLRDLCLEVLRIVTELGQADEIACAVKAGVIEWLFVSGQFFGSILPDEGPEDDTFRICCEIAANLVRRCDANMEVRFKEVEMIGKVLFVLTGDRHGERGIVVRIVRAIVETGNMELVDQFLEQGGLPGLIELLGAMEPDVNHEILEVLGQLYKRIPELEDQLIVPMVVDAINGLLNAEPDEDLAAKSNSILLLIQGAQFHANM